MQRATASPGALRYASYEAVYGWTDQSWGRLTAAAPASWHMHREHLDRESHESIGMLSMYLGLREVFRDYSILSAPKMPTTSILPYYEKVSASLGATVLPPRKLLRQVAEDLLMEGRGAATPAEMGPYLGEWVGDTWMGAGEPRHGDQLLRIKVVDGRVVGESVTRMPSGKELVQAWTYMRVTANGLTWGYMNGMRPRAMLLHEGTRTGETLAGTLRFGGVNFRMGDGTMPPTISFAFKRVRSG